jgi:hypothetical protein
MATKKEIAYNKKMSTNRMSSSKNKKMTPSIDGSKSTPPAKKGRAENVKKDTFSSTKKLKRK